MIGLRSAGRSRVTFVRCLRSGRGRRFFFLFGSADAGGRGRLVGRVHLVGGVGFGSRAVADAFRGRLGLVGRGLGCRRVRLGDGLLHLLGGSLR